MTTTSCRERVRQQTPHLVLDGGRKLAPTPWTPSCGPRSLGELARPAAQAPSAPLLTPAPHRAMLPPTPRGATDGPLEPPSVRAGRGYRRLRAAGGGRARRAGRRTTRKRSPHWLSETTRPGSGWRGVR